MRIFIGVILVFCSFVTRAEDLYCTGKVDQLIVYGTGELSILSSWRGDWTFLCNVNTGKPVDSVTCSHWSSLATTAFKDGATVGVYYYAPAGMTCANMPTYGSSPTPVYFRLVTPQ